MGAKAERRYDAGMRFCLRDALLFLGTASIFHPAFADAPLRAQVEAGAALWASSGCSHCHGANGEGGDIGPSLLDVGRRLKPEAISMQIHNGGKVMPAFDNVLTGDQISDLVAYLRTKRAKTPKQAQAPPQRGQ